MTEFELIQQYFTAPSCSKQNASSAGVLLDKGDDCAVITPTAGKSLVVTTDTLVCGVHFLPTISAVALAHRALATNLSDLAAMGAKPKWFSLALTLPDATEDWLKEFSRGLHQLADQHSIYLIGGDTTKGPLSITITAMGEISPAYSLRRDSAKVGDDIYVTGTVGDAAGALCYLLNEEPIDNDNRRFLNNRFEFPSARIAVGTALAQFANSALDISDGLLADLGHILKASQVNARIEVSDLPLSAALVSEFGIQRARELALTGGDDYELCFTASTACAEKIARLSAEMDIRITKIGQIMPFTQPPYTAVCYLKGNEISFNRQGYQHFND